MENATIDPGALGAAAVVAAFLVPVVSLIKRPTWSDKTKYALGMVAALVSAIVGAVIDGNVKNLAEGLAYFGTALATSNALYTLFFRDTAINQALGER